MTKQVIVVTVPTYRVERGGGISTGIDTRVFKSCKSADRCVLQALRKAVKVGDCEPFEDASERSRRAGRVLYALSNLAHASYTPCKIEP